MIGTGAYLESLRRTRIGEIELEGVPALDALREMGAEKVREDDRLHRGIQKLKNMGDIRIVVITDITEKREGFSR